jgi:hypothetical protein
MPFTTVPLRRTTAAPQAAISGYGRWESVAPLHRQTAFDGLATSRLGQQRRGAPMSTPKRPTGEPTIVDSCSAGRIAGTWQSARVRHHCCAR